MKLGTVIPYLKKTQKICEFLILLTFFKSLKIFLINMVTILMVSAKLATLGLLKIKIFQNKGYDVIIPNHDVTSKILSVNQIVL